MAGVSYLLAGAGIALLTIGAALCAMGLRIGYRRNFKADTTEDGVAMGFFMAGLGGGLAGLLAFLVWALIVVTQ